MKHIGYVEVPADLAMNAGAAAVAYVDARREQMRIQAEAEALAELEAKWARRGFWRRKDPMPTPADAAKLAVYNICWHRVMPKVDFRRWQENLRSIGEEIMELCFAANGTGTIWLSNEAAGVYRNGRWYADEARKISDLNARFTA